MTQRKALEMAVALIVEQAAYAAKATGETILFQRNCSDLADTLNLWAQNPPDIGPDPEGLQNIRLCYLSLGGMPEMSN